jgi:hypothetical protein
LSILAKLAGLNPSSGIVSSSYNDNFIDNTNLKKIFIEADKFFRNNLIKSDHLQINT